MSETNELLLQILFRNYEEEVARNELIDNKNSQMIVLTGTMLTLQATLFTSGLLNEFVYGKIITSHCLKCMFSKEIFKTLKK